MDRYEIVERIGEGSFGEVHKARDRLTGLPVALKRVRLRNVEGRTLPNTALREMRALQELAHPNVIRLLDIFAQASSIVLVFEYMITDLAEVIRRSKRELTEAEVKSFMKMLLEGVEFCHSSGIMHRDLKPANLLISPAKVLKIGDFGLARVHAQGRTDDYTHQVATRWYRAPELLFGAKKYGFEVDIWAVGAIFGELLCQSPLFPGENDIDQIFRVIQVLGTPKPEKWPGLVDLPDYNKINFPQFQPMAWEEVLPQASPLAIDLIQGLLQYNPADRVTAEQALRHPFFSCHALPSAPRDLPVSKVDLQAPEGGAKRLTAFHADTARLFAPAVDPFAEAEKGTPPGRPGPAPSSS